MFKCQKCKKLSAPGEKQKRVVVDTRKRFYTNHKGEPAGEGWEIVKEVALCSSCAPVPVV